MQVGQFPASAANSLIQGYCDDFVSLAAILAQTLEQISMRGLNFDGSRPALQRIEHGMRNLADAIADLLARGKVTGDLSTSLQNGPPPNASPPAPRPAAAPATARPAAAATRPANDVARGPAARAPAPPPPARTAVLPAAPAAQAAPRAPAPPTATVTQARSAQAPGNLSAPRNTPPRPAAEGLRGTSVSMPLLSVFQFLGRLRKAGTMRVQVGEEMMQFDIQNGCILSSLTSKCPPQERLGELLVELGHCRAEDLAAIVAKVDSGALDRFGQLAIEAGIVTDQQVVAALELQVNRRFSRACKSPTAAYEFLEGMRHSAEGRFRIQPFSIA